MNPLDYSDIETLNILDDKLEAEAKGKHMVLKKDKTVETGNKGRQDRNGTRVFGSMWRQTQKKT
jgi:hypothetical protein